MITRFASLALAALLLFGCDASKSGPQSTTGGDGDNPRIEIVGGDTVDWGSVPPGVLKHTIRITNTGGDTLRIAEVKPSCGCTTAPLDKQVLMPGDTASVDVSVDVAHSSGSVSKHLTVTSNDSSRPQIIMTLKANLVRDITVIPEIFPLSTTAVAGQELATSVALKNTSDKPLSVGPPQIGEAAEMVVRFDMDAPVVLQPGDTTTVVAHVRPLKSGVAQTDVVIPTNSKDMPSVGVRLTVSAQ